MRRIGEVNVDKGNIRIDLTDDAPTLRRYGHDGSSGDFPSQHWQLRLAFANFLLILRQRLLIGLADRLLLCL